MCEKLATNVSPEFCQSVCCTGRYAEKWQNRKLTMDNTSFALPCAGCKHYKAECNSCLLLTRQTNLNKWFSDGNRCPLEAKSQQQPKIHPAKYKKIFMRANGSQLDMVDMYRGQTAFIVASGPSFANVDKEMLQRPGIVTMAVNNAGHLFRPTLWTAQDPPHKFMASIWRDPKITKFTLFDHRRKYYWDNQTDQMGTVQIGDCPNVIFHHRDSKFNASDWLQRDKVYWGDPKRLDDGSAGSRCVLMAALHILYFLGFARVYLVGVDFTMSDQNKYWFEQDRTSAAIRNNHRVYKYMSKHLAALQPYLLEAGFKVFNCNPDSELKAFPFYPLDKAIAENEIKLTESTKGMYERK